MTFTLTKKFGRQDRESQAAELKSPDGARVALAAIDTNKNDGDHNAFQRTARCGVN